MLASAPWRYSPWTSDINGNLPESTGAYRPLTVLPIGNRRVEINFHRALPVGLTAGTAAR